MRTLPYLLVFSLGLGAIWVLNSQSVLAQRDGERGRDGQSYQYRSYQPVDGQPGGGPPPWMQGGGQQPPSGPPPWMQGSSGYSGRGGPPGSTQGYPPPPPQPGQPSGGMSSDLALRMVARLRSMDTNGNGILEPSEISDSRRPFVDAIVRQLGGSASSNGSIDLARLERQAGSNTPSQTSSPQPPYQPPQYQPPQSDSSSGRSSRQQPVEPLVRPFGESSPNEPPILGFGQRDVASQQSYSGRGSRSSRSSNNTASANQQQAISNTIGQSSVYDSLPETVRNNPQFSWFFAYDTDKDAQLSMTEYIRGRGGVWTQEIATEFQKLDRNGDGFVTVEEALSTIKDIDEKKVQDAQEQQSTENSQPGQPPVIPERPTAPPGMQNYRPPGTSYQSYQRPTTPGSSGYTPSRDSQPSSRRDYQPVDRGSSSRGGTFQDNRRSSSVGGR